MKNWYPFLAIAIAIQVMFAIPAYSAPTSGSAAIIHDAEYYIIEAQNGKAWAVEDGKLDKKLAELRKKYDSPPNIIHYMWDDQPMNGAMGPRN